VRRTWLNEPGLTGVDLGRIEAPTLVVAGEQDYVRVEHTRQLAALIHGSRLALLPGGNENGLLAEQPVRIADLVLEFLR